MFDGPHGCSKYFFLTYGFLRYLSTFPCFIYFILSLISSKDTTKYNGLRYIYSLYILFLLFTAFCWPTHSFTHVRRRQEVAEAGRRKLEQFRKQKASQSPPPHSLMLLIQMDLMFHLQSLMKLRLTPSLHFLFDMCYLHPKKDGSKERSQRDDFEMKNTDIFISENTPPDRINGRVIMKKPQTRTVSEI
ncbi:unnamed protein product [Brassica napus]|uniref:(rape) hypothetical protein n=1 Tax=Brassica napus TaxID=3708 RepID=A0A816UK29_BRANA|nr:unnamed protein product [Brassica napus]